MLLELKTLNLKPTDGLNNKNYPHLYRYQIEIPTFLASVFALTALD